MILKTSLKRRKEKLFRYKESVKIAVFHVKTVKEMKKSGEYFTRLYRNQVSVNSPCRELRR
jgi:hypothetical protein